MGITLSCLPSQLLPSWHLVFFVPAWRHSPWAPHTPAPSAPVACDPFDAATIMMMMLMIYFEQCM